jgi:peptidoglycan/LPS O-acetylase OafA/YrhL
LSLIAVAAAYPPVFAKHIHIVAFVADLMMIQTWSARMVNFFNIPAWSLSCEAFFYLVFPFVFLKLRPKSRSHAVWWIVGLWVLAMVPPLISLYVTPAQAWDESVMGGLFVFRVRRIPLLMLAEFLAGIPLAWLFLRFRPSQRMASVLCLVGGVGLAVGLFFAQHLPYVMLANGIMIPFYAMLILGLCEDNWLTRALSVRPLILLGEASYALYLFHLTFSDWVRYRFGASTSIEAAMWKLAILIPITIGLHIFVERPCRTVLLRWWNRKSCADGGS